MTTSNTSRIEQIKNKLEETFSPLICQLTDNSAAHAGHAGASEGQMHLSLKITSNTFKDLSLVECHRMIYQTLNQWMQHDIHALSIDVVDTTK